MADKVLLVVPLPPEPELTLVNHSAAVAMMDSSTTATTTRYFSSYQELELLNHNWQLAIMVLYTFTAAMAFFGNIISICVLIFGKRSSKELRIFLVNLSMSDIMMALFSIPFTYTDFMLGRWIFAPSFCPVVQQMQITCVFVSVYTLTAIGIDRYIAIIYPLFSQRYNRSFGPITILIIWIFGFILGLFQWANTEAQPFMIGNETNYDCKEIWSSEQTKFFTVLLFVITFALPMTILSFTYGSIGRKIFRHSTPGNADVARDKAQQSSKVKIMKMLVTIVILFVVCWLPVHILNLFIYFARDLMEAVYNSQAGFTIYVTIAFTAHWLSMANSFVNPIIYCFMSENFRADLRDLFPECLRLINVHGGDGDGDGGGAGGGGTGASGHTHHRHCHRHHRHHRFHRSSLLAMKSVDTSGSMVSGFSSTTGSNAGSGSHPHLVRHDTIDSNNNSNSMSKKKLPNTGSHFCQSSCDNNHHEDGDECQTLPEQNQFHRRGQKSNDGTPEDDHHPNMEEEAIIIATSLTSNTSNLIKQNNINDHNSSPVIINYGRRKQTPESVELLITTANNESPELNDDDDEEEDNIIYEPIIISNNKLLMNQFQMKPLIVGNQNNRGRPRSGRLDSNKISPMVETKNPGREAKAVADLRWHGSVGHSTSAEVAPAGRESPRQPPPPPSPPVSEPTERTKKRKNSCRSHYAGGGGGGGPSQAYRKPDVDDGSTAKLVGSTDRTTTTTTTTTTQLASPSLQEVIKSSSSRPNSNIGDDEDEDDNDHGDDDDHCSDPLMNRNHC